MDAKKKVQLAEIKKLRARTGAGMVDARNALLEGGSFEKALLILRRKGAKILEEKSSRITSQGTIASYIHLGGKVGAMVELKCETDFVARSEIFQKLAYEIAVQVAGMAPRYLSLESVPFEEKRKHQDLEGFAREFCLLEQPLIKDPQKTVRELINEVAFQVRENIGVVRFVRFALGEMDNA